MKTYLIVDTETSGLVSPVRACEIAFIKIDENLNTLDEQVYLTDPQITMDPGAVAIHGITNEQVKGFPSNSEICAKMPQPFVWVGHNSSYDQRVIAEHVTFNGNLCTLALARRWISHTTNHKLGTLQKELGLSAQKSHSALGDCRTTKDLLKVLLDKSGRALPALLELESKPKVLPKMPFGMHRGKLFSDIPKSYIRWMTEQEDWHPDILYTLNHLKLLA
jgi:DNA polymerase III epsilon subunit-like protein